MKKILVGFIMDGRSGGIDNYLENFLKNVHSSEVRIDFMTSEVDTELEKELLRYNSKLFAIPRLRNPVAQYKSVCGLIRAGGYDMVYLNVSTAIDMIAGFASKKMGVKTRIIHSHSSGNDCRNTFRRTTLNIINAICRKFMYKSATSYIGCSVKAGEWIFPKHIVKSQRFGTIFNAVDFDKYKYDADIRSDVRKELGIEDKKALVCIGNFCYQKNQEFLIDVMREVIAIDKNIILIYAGKGSDEEMVKTMAKDANIESNIIFAGYRTDVDRLLSGMDVFLLPSRFEGLPTVAVEAQCAGLPCIISDTITPESRITENCMFLSIQDKRLWAEAILQSKAADREHISWIGDKDDYKLSAIRKQQQELIEKA